MFLRIVCKPLIWSTAVVLLDKRIAGDFLFFIPLTGRRGKDKTEHKRIFDVSNKPSGNQNIKAKQNKQICIDS